ncbi:MAG: lytic transglycosylase domain-containing protein [Myxococcales bacterium]|nr:lytic transglycosylase domain-containing protein [Myxococcales bacterium]
MPPCYHIFMRWLGMAAAALGLALAFGGGAGGGVTSAAADIYSHTDADGELYFTNIAPRGAERKKWKKVLVSEPEAGSKASAKRGACVGCDRVPARDMSAERFTRYDVYIYEAAALYQLPPALIRAVMHTESNYDPNVVSGAGAQGLMQLMPGTATEQGVQNAFDPRENILGGARYLRLMANRFSGDLALTAAAYNAGPGAVAKYNNSVPPYRETMAYVARVQERYAMYLAQEQAGKK